MISWIWLLLVSFSIGHVPSLPRCHPQQLSQRKNINSLTPNELKKYFNAIAKLSTGTEVSRWQAWADVARDRIKSQASDTLFWQRLYLLGVEKDLQAIDPTVTIPYWDWSNYATHPIADPVLQRSKLGAITNNTCIILTQIPGFEPVYYDWKSKTTKCLQRDEDWDKYEFPTFRELDRNILNLDMLKLFEMEIRNLWPQLDSDRNQILPFQPEDPLFISHLAFLDKLWFDWQNRNPLLYHRSLSPGATPIAPWGIPLKQVVDPCTRICAHYSEEHFSWSGKLKPVRNQVYQCQWGPLQSPV